MNTIKLAQKLSYIAIAIALFGVSLGFINQPKIPYSFYIAGEFSLYTFAFVVGGLLLMFIGLIIAITAKEVPSIPDKGN